MYRYGGWGVKNEASRVDEAGQGQECRSFTPAKPWGVFGPIEDGDPRADGHAGNCYEHYYHEDTKSRNG